MSKIIMKSPYLKPSDKGSAAKYLKYVATREGVEFVSDSKKYLPATYKQKQLIKTILGDIPDSKDLHEYKDYISNPTRENATEFISTALEIAEGSYESREMYVKYIAERPRVEKLGKHGLFSDEGKPVVIADVMSEIENSNSNVWGHIISLTREDAERLGYNNADAWMQLLRSQRNYIAEQMHIAPKNFRWYAAFHNEGHHPHVHLIAYSVKPNEAYLTTKGIENIKSSLSKKIFKDDRINVYKEQTHYRDELKQSSKVLVSDFIEQINTGVLDNPKMEDMLVNLAQRLSTVNGRKQYGYLDKDIKVMIDDIVDELEKDERIDSLYEMWYSKEKEVISFYTDNYPKRQPLSQNKVFKSIKNMIISEAMHILSQTEVDHQTDNDDVAPEVLDEDAETEMPSEDKEYAVMKRDAKRGNHWSQYKLAKHLINQENKHYNPSEAIEWFTKSASQGNSVAQYMLGKIYIRGEIIEKDIESAVEWLNKAVENGNPFAEYLLGKEYLKGNDLPLDIVTAVELLDSASKSGNKYACYTLGKLLFEGVDWSRDAEKGLKLLEESAEKGFQYAQYYLGKLYAKGSDVPKDLKKAVSLLSKAGMQNNPYALYLLGKIFSTEETAIDMEKAIRCYRLAAKHGNNYAEYQLGRIYLYGKGVEKDYYKAIEYLTLAASKGNQYAQQLLYSAERHRNAFAATSGLSLLKSIARAMQESINEQERKNRLKAQSDYVDKKTRSKIVEKKQAHGLKVEM